MKNRIRAFSLIMAFVLMVSVLAGCSQSESGFISIYKKMVNLKKYETSFGMNISVNKLNVGQGSDSEKIKNAMAVLSSYSITGTGKYDLEKGTGDMSFRLAKNGTGTSSSPLRMILDDRYVYVDTAGMFDVLSYAVKNDSKLMGMSAEDVSELEEARQIITSKAGYVKIDLTDPSIMGAKDNSMALSSPMSKMGLKDSIAMNKLYMRFIEGAQAEALKTYESKLVSTNGNSYVFAIDSNNAPEMILNLMSYVIDNADSFESYISAFMNTMTPSEFAMFGLTSQSDIDSAKSGVTDAFKEIKKSKETFNSQKDMLLKSMQEGAKSFNGTRYQLSLSEGQNGTFNEKQDLRFVMNMDEAAIDMALASSTDIREVGSVSVDVPTNAVDIKKLGSAMTRSLSVSAKSGDYTFSKDGSVKTGKMKTYRKGGYNYVPLKQVAGMFSDTVMYDSLSRTMRFSDDLKNFKTVAGEMVASTFYVKASQLRDLGYTVEWDAEKGTVEISKTSIEYLKANLK